MKYHLLIFALGGISLTSLHAQTPSDVDAVTQVLPESWQAYATFALVLLPLLGRAWHALIHNGGLRGVWNAVMFGTNTPQAKVLLLCASVLALSSCATASALLSSPFGRATLAGTDALAQKVIQVTEQTALEQLILQAGSRVAALLAAGVHADAAQETLRQSELAGFAGVVRAAQAKYTRLTGHAYAAPKNPSPALNP